MQSSLIESRQDVVKYRSWRYVHENLLSLVPSLCLFSWASTEIKSSWTMPTKSARTTWVPWSLSPWNNQRRVRKRGRCRWKLTSTRPVFRKDQWESCCLVSQGNHVWNLWPVGERGEADTPRDSLSHLNFLKHIFKSMAPSRHLKYHAESSSLVLLVWWHFIYLYSPDFLKSVRKFYLNDPPAHCLLISQSWRRAGRMDYQRELSYHFSRLARTREDKRRDSF